MKCIALCIMVPMLAVVVGCAVADKSATDTPETVAAADAAPEEKDSAATEANLLKAARVLLDKQENNDAAKDYLNLKENTKNRDVRFDAAFGAAIALQRLGRLPAAIGVLMPAPLVATTPREARHLALLGELYLRSRALGTASHWLQTALECPELPTATWVAVAHFNLGKCLISLDAPAEAIAAFDAAERDFMLLGNVTAAELCTSAVRQLQSIDRLSAPHRFPGPVRKKLQMFNAAPPSAPPAGLKDASPAP